MIFKAVALRFEPMDVFGVLYHEFLVLPWIDLNVAFVLFGSDNSVLLRLFFKAICDTRFGLL